MSSEEFEIVFSEDEEFDSDDDHTQGYARSRSGDSSTCSSTTSADVNNYRLMKLMLGRENTTAAPVHGAAVVNGTSPS